MNKRCPEIYQQQGCQDRPCVLDCYHVGCCRDETGFQFTVEHYPLGFKIYWPDSMGNGPSGYPMNNKSFDKAAKEVLDSRKADMERADRFLEMLNKKGAKHDQ